MKEKEKETYKQYLKSVGDYMVRNGYTVEPLPKVILDDSDQGDDVFCYTGYFDPNSNAVRLFTKNRLMKDVLRTWAHELIHWKQQKDGTIAKSGYKSDKITEDKNLIRLEGEAYLKGNMAFRSWTEEEKKKKNGERKMMNESAEGDDGKFTPDIAWMSYNYDKANRELFNGKLKACEFAVEHLRSKTLGMFSMTGSNLYHKRSNGKMFMRNSLGWGAIQDILIDNSNFVQLAKPKITINSSYRGSESSWYNTLVHEMCHYYTYMNGWAPRQAHGTEFRDIASVVSYRSNGTINIQRLASAEEAEDYELDSAEQAKIDKRKENKRNRADYYVVIDKSNGAFKLVNTNSQDVIIEIVRIESKRGNPVYHIVNKDITNELYDSGYKSAARKYRYWPLPNNTEIINRALSGDNYEQIS